VSLIPFVCHWKKDRVEVTQTVDGKDVHYNGIYNVINKNLCEDCGNPYTLKIGGEYSCLEDKLHERLSDIDRMVQLGFYYRKDSMFMRMEDDILNEHIWGLKKDADFAMPLAQAMFLAIKENFPFLLEADTIVCVPNHHEDYHADAKAVALGSELCKQYNLEGCKVNVTQALIKTKNISIHMSSDIEKEGAVKGMYEFNSTETVKNKKVVLVDDILTKGYQKGKCASLLKENGAAKIWGYTAGRTV